MKRFLFISWGLIALFAIYGAFPVRLPDKAPVLVADQILVQHHEYTGSPDFTIVKGTLIIPDSLKPLLTDSSYNITIAGNSPLNYTSDGNFDFLMKNFILEGKVIGIDSTSGGNEGIDKYKPVFKVVQWEMTDYYARFWTFNILFFILYFTLFPVLFIATIVVLIISLVRKKNKKTPTV
ncbi:MAG TPA: hypothetical protein VK718_03795 [Ferruginibacter sp.]|jgi:hypothetical protein|nr:hypothetical protein [Ferruginibacter sp.]